MVRTDLSAIDADNTVGKIRLASGIGREGACSVEFRKQVHAVCGCREIRGCRAWVPFGRSHVGRFPVVFRVKNRSIKSLLRVDGHLC